MCYGLYALCAIRRVNLEINVKNTYVMQEKAVGILDHGKL